MNPYISDETARQRRLQLQGEAAVHRQQRIAGRGSGTAGRTSSRATTTALVSDAGIRQHDVRQQLGLALIRAGMRIVDPQTAIPSRSR